MPIRKSERSRYPKDSKAIRDGIVARAQNRCEWCGVRNHTRRDYEQKGPEIVLTVAHLNHKPEDCRPENLAALCQRCHNRHDAQHRADGRRHRANDSPGQMSLLPGEGP